MWFFSINANWILSTYHYFINNLFFKATMWLFTSKRVLLIFTWGTVAWNVASSNVTEQVKSDWNSFLNSLENSVEIIKKNRNIEIDTSIEELINIDSSNLQPEHRTQIIEKVKEKYDEFDAFIVLHGTNTMWYSAAAASFAFENINKPIIFTWAQVPLGYLGSDSETNLVNSLRIAVRWYHEVKWVMAVFWSKIITWTRVKKGTDFDYDPFRAFQTWTLWQIGRFIRIDENSLAKHVGYLSKKKPLAIQSRVLSVKSEFNTRIIWSLTEFPGMSVETFRLLVEHNWI